MHLNWGLLNMRAFGFQAKLFLLLGIFIAGFGIATAFLFVSLDRVKVNGPIYADLKQSYDLLADILPPPEYLIEDYLTSLQMFGATPEELPKLVETSQRLAKEFTDRHQYWQTNLRNQSFRDIIDQKTYPAGKKTTLPYHPDNHSLQTFPVKLATIDHPPSLAYI